MIFEVNRQDFRETRLAEGPASTLAAGQVRLAVERFAFTSNNISYAVAGDMLDYWGFFPTEAPWGRIPAIGLGSVVESANPDIGVGGRWFGFYPMGTDLVVDAQRRGTSGFRDVGAHRAGHAVSYTDFRDISADPTFDLGRVDEYLLLYGMFMTSFLVDDQLGERGFEGAATTIVTSASSKTSISLASCLAARDDISAVGLTSARNRAFVERLGLYDHVITYDEIDQLDARVRAGVVDMAGSAEIRAAIHRHYGDALAFSISVGATHWDERDADTGPLPGPTPEFFFAPGQMATRVQEWGADELQSRIQTAYRNLVDHSAGWLRVEHRQGPEGIEATYRDLLEGRADPAAGFICSMHTDALA
jgi:Protein of unknown function (DUF2855)